jgi:hypothetical protein
MGFEPLLYLELDQPFPTTTYGVITRIELQLCSLAASTSEVNMDVVSFWDGRSIRSWIFTHYDDPRNYACVNHHLRRLPPAPLLYLSHRQSCQTWIHS